MVKLEQLKAGQRLIGIIPGKEIITVKSVEFTADRESAVVYFTDNNGRYDRQILYRGDEKRLTSETKPLRLFTGDGKQLRLAYEARRLELAYLFDPYLAVYNADVEPLPHQITAVYEEMLPRQPLRYILADDPGAGKTIMTGLYIKELELRGALTHCLIITPGRLSEQWQEELQDKFALKFKVLTKDKYKDRFAGDNLFNEYPFWLAGIDFLKPKRKDTPWLTDAENINWDLIVVDEAHKMSATGTDKKSARFKLGEKLSPKTRNFLLLTATPHNGKDQDFQMFLSLIDPDRYGANKSEVKNSDLTGVMRRLVKEDLYKMDGTPLFPPRIAQTVNYSLAAQEKDLYEAVTDYVRHEFDRADTIDGKQKRNIGFALTILQRSLASSTKSILSSLEKRRQKLKKESDNLFCYSPPPAN